MMKLIKLDFCKVLFILCHDLYLHYRSQMVKEQSEDNQGYYFIDSNWYQNWLSFINTQNECTANG